MKLRATLVVGAVAMLAVAVPAQAQHRHVAPTAAAQEGTNTNPQTYTDASNDSGTAPDIRTVVVSNDTSGNFTFRINVPQLTVPSDVVFFIAFDTDENSSTGQSGADYLFLCDESNDTFALGRWNGSTFAPTGSSSLKVEDSSTGVTATINSSDLGGSTALRFVVISVEGSSAVSGHVDLAPDSGSWDYDMTQPAALKLTVAAFAAPKTVKAGKNLVVAMAAQRSDTSELVSGDDGGTVACRATVGGKRLKLGQSGFVTVGSEPAAGCLWHIAKRFRGKTIRGSITVALNGASVTRTFVVRVK
jgi:hypothetical protein